jgi:hypothetical protein
MEERPPTEKKEAAVPQKPTLSLKQMYDARKRAQVSPQVLFQKFSAAFHAGAKAKRMQLARVSVIYGDPLADEFFFAGYDGQTWEEAVKKIIATPKPQPVPANA